MKRFRMIFVGMVLLVMLMAVFGICAGNAVAGEKIEFQSTSPYDFNHILDGPDNDPKTTIYGELVFPKDTKGKVPALVFVHGSGGKGKKHLQWLRMFQEMGFATLRLDCFKDRGVSSTVGKQIVVTGSMMTVDAFNALKFLSNHPRIDKDKIGIIGGSKGGGVALYSVWDPIRLTTVGDKLKFAFHIALYPPCVQFEMKVFTGAPLLILIGEKDNWTPAAPCEELVGSMNGYDVKLSIYPDAYHAFDADYSVHTNRNAFNLTNCHWVITSDGNTIESNSGLDLSSQESKKKAFKACATKGSVKSGRNQKALKEAKIDVREFIKKVGI